MPRGILITASGSLPTAVRNTLEFSDKSRNQGVEVSAADREFSSAPHGSRGITLETPADLYIYNHLILKPHGRLTLACAACRTTSEPRLGSSQHFLRALGPAEHVSLSFLNGTCS